MNLGEMKIGATNVGIFNAWSDGTKTSLYFLKLLAFVLANQMKTKTIRVIRLLINFTIVNVQSLLLYVDSYCLHTCSFNETMWNYLPEAHNLLWIKNWFDFVTSKKINEKWEFNKVTMMQNKTCDRTLLYITRDVSLNYFCRWFSINSVSISCPILSTGWPCKISFLNFFKCLNHAFDLFMLYFNMKMFIFSTPSLRIYKSWFLIFLLFSSFILFLFWKLYDLFHFKFQLSIYGIFHHQYSISYTLYFENVLVLSFRFIQRPTKCLISNSCLCNFVIT